jgi:N-acetylmuramoyl-L-alanine amidase
MIRSALAHDFVLAPNVEPRRGAAWPDMLILHYTGMADARLAREWLCSTGSGVSCHYLVDEQGAITQMAGEEMRAWHAGESSWQGETDINSRSIGIEIHNPGHLLGYRDFPAEQMKAVAALCRDVAQRHRIAARRILAHSDVAPSRKIDPGEKFDWRFLHEQGVGHWVPPAPIVEGNVLQPGDEGEAVRDLQQALARYGYGIGTTGSFDGITKNVVAAFQRHFRPARVDGIADLSTRLTLEHLNDRVA